MAIVKRATKGSALTHDELDGNFTDLEGIRTGKAGGQTLTGGTASGENLKLKSTTHASKGKVYLDDAETIYSENGKLYKNGVEYIANPDIGFGINPMKRVVITEHFLSGSTSDKLIGANGWSITGLSGNQEGPLQNKLPGFTIQNSSTTAGTVGAMFLYNTSRTGIYFNNFESFIFRFYQQNLAAADLSMRLGISSVASDITSSSGIGAWVEKLTGDTNFLAYSKSANSSTITRTDLGIAYTQGTAYAFKMVKNGAGNIEIYHTTDTGDTWTLLTTLTSLIPSGTQTLNIGVQIISTGTNRPLVVPMFSQIILNNL